MEMSIETIAAEADIPGFRKGRVPRQVVEKRFGRMIRSETKNQLVSSAYSEAVQQNNLRVLGEPENAENLDDLAIEPGSPVTFSLEVEVAPEFELPDLDGIEVKKPSADVPDEMVEEQIEQLRQNEGDLEPQEQAEAGDFCIGKGDIKDEEGTERLTLDGAVIQIPKKDSDGSGAVLGVLVSDFATQVGSPKTGDTLEIKTVGPENHENPELRGKKLTVTFEISQIQRIVPASIEDLTARFGLTDEKQLHETIALQLNQRAVINQQAAMREQIADHLLDSVEMDLPEKLTQGQAERNMQRQRMEMMYRGVDPMLIEQRMAELRAKSQESARRELKLFFILASVAEKFNVQVNEEEVRGRIAQIAAERNMRPQDLFEQLMQQNQIPQVAQQIREHKAIDEVLTRAKVVEEATS
jgi:trigger factor